MSKQALPDGANWLTPYLTVSNCEETLDFYARAFGFEEEMKMPDKAGDTVHASMTYQGRSIVMFAPEGAWGGTSKTPAHAGVEVAVGFYVYCADVDALIERARKAGAEVSQEPEDMFWGDRIGTVRDPDGYAWTFATQVGEFDPSKIPPM